MFHFHHTEKRYFNVHSSTHSFTVTSIQQTSGNTKINKAWSHYTMNSYQCLVREQWVNRP